MRLETLGGRLELIARPDGGTRAIARLPVPEAPTPPGSSGAPVARLARRAHAAAVTSSRASVENVHQ